MAETYLFLVFLSVSSFFLCWGLSFLCIKYFPALGFVDKPRKLHIHKTPVPSGGGIVIFITFFVIFTFYILFCIINGKSFFLSENLIFIKQIFPPVLLLIIIGLVDDKYEISPLVKFFFQISAASWCYFIGIKISTIFGYQLPVYLSIIATVLWITAFINSFNMIDGLDGLACGIGFFSFLCMGIIFIISSHFSINDASAPLILTTTCLAFLIYNFFPAKIYLGDTGSTFIGFMVSVFGIKYVSISKDLTAMYVPILAAVIPVLDVILAVWRRSAKKILLKLNTNIKQESKTKVKLTGRDLEHIHHRVLGTNKSHLKTVIKLYNLSTIGVLISIIMELLNHDFDIFLLIILLIIVFITMINLSRVELNITKKIFVAFFKLRSK